MASSPITIDSVPNEVLFAVLESFSTRELLPFAEINQRFLAAVVRILDARLAKVATLPEQRLILECYHPSAKISTPYLFCNYLSTGPLETSPQAGEEPGRGSSFAELNGLYSRFRPVVQEENRRARYRYPRRAAPGEAAALDASTVQPPLANDLASHDITLDEAERFSQLCVVTNLVKVGPRRGLFLSHVNISENVVRVFRPWLAAQAARRLAEQAGESTGPRDDAILWADDTHNVGLLLRVVEQEDSQRTAPVLVAADEDQPVAYKLEYDEVVIRTNQLLLMAEKSEAQEAATSGKAIIIASAD